MKITLRWDDSSVELSNPTVYEGSSGVGVVSLAVPASFAGAVRAGTAPKPVAMPVTRQGTRASGSVAPKSAPVCGSNIGIQDPHCPKIGG